MRLIDLGRTESFVSHDTGAQRPAQAAGKGDRVALDHEVDVRSGCGVEQRVSDDPTNKAHRVGGSLGRTPKQRVCLNGCRNPLRMIAMTYDPLSHKLREAAPIAIPELLELFARFEGLSLTQLQEEFAACEARFRAWVEAPENAGRPITESPDYRDRIALDSLIERRMWAE